MIRDQHSNALINTDLEKLSNRRREKEEKRKLLDRIKRLEERLDTLEALIHD